jgi:hypothetical protein
MTMAEPRAAMRRHRTTANDFDKQITTTRPMINELKAQLEGDPRKVAVQRISTVAIASKYLWMIGMIIPDYHADAHL